jgi:hypothetical protein
MMRRPSSFLVLVLVFLAVMGCSKERKDFIPSEPAPLPQGSPFIMGAPTPGTDQVPGAQAPAENPLDPKGVTGKGPAEKKGKPL